ncbi:MAG TPA: hypothetical protein VG455_05900 [Acidimicrobiales bacterium]|nr:hypothetical protein [Acidimicrobiales bacterium]
MAGAADPTSVAAGRGTTAYGREAGRMSTRSLVQMPVWRIAADFGG